MPRFAWVAWGLLVVVIDLPYHGWDVLSDIVGFIWIVIGFAGSQYFNMELVRARALAGAGVPVALVTSTPLFVNFPELIWGAVLADTLIVVAIIQQMCQGLNLKYHDYPMVSSWTKTASSVALAAGVITVFGLIGYNTGLQGVLRFGQILLVVAGILGVIIVQRMIRLDLIRTHPED